MGSDPALAIDCPEQEGAVLHSRDSWDEEQRDYQSFENEAML